MVLIDLPSILKFPILINPVLNVRIYDEPALLSEFLVCYLDGQHIVHRLILDDFCSRQLVHKSWIIYLKKKVPLVVHK